MTNVVQSTMPSKEDLTNLAQQIASLPRPRPPLSNRPSHSVPSTPLSHTRKNSFGARSPSPQRHENVRNGSPQSTRSVLENGYRSKAPSFTGCKYETGMAFSRRRIPYSVGGDQLERAKAPPKKFLNTEQERKLRLDMRALYNTILPSKESDQHRASFVHKLDRILNNQWPGNEIQVHVFGSSGNLLCTSDSDVDICITTTMKALEKVCMLAKVLADHGMKRVVCVPHAKVPIVKFWDPELELACDMNVNNTLALDNTKMIKTYVEIDERVRPLAMIIKHWTKRRILNDAALGGTLSSYTWICMILNFLQTRSPPILPSLHNKPHQRRSGADGRTPPFDDDIERYRGYGKNNKESISELLFNFFRRYAHDLGYDRDVISVREGRLVSKEAKRWHLMQNNRLCVEEPFNTERNLGNTADDISFRGIHLELRRAFDLISDARLEECLEQYEFPAAEEKVWERPPPKPIPVLRSRSQSQSSRAHRGGQVQRGGKSGLYQANNRRASSAAATNKYPVSATDTQSGRARDRDHLSRDEAHFYNQQQAMALHAQLMNQMQVLAVHEQELRYRQAQTQQAQLQEANERISGHQATPREHRASSAGLLPFSAPLRPAQFTQPWVYPQVPGTPSVHTQPSSPSLQPAQPSLRRGLHRTATQENISRSHSQPARSLPLGTNGPNGAPLSLDAQSFLLFQQQIRQQQQLYEALEQSHHQSRHMRPDLMTYQDPRHVPMDLGFEDNIPKEYVGYWVNDTPGAHHGREGFPSQMPLYQDVCSRSRGAPPSFDRPRKSSRSPSPSVAQSTRVRSYSVRSTASAPMGPGQSDPIQARVQSNRNGPVIISGTDEWTVPEYLPPVDISTRTTISDTNSGSDEQQYETPISADLDTPVNGIYYEGDHMRNHAHPYLYNQPATDVYQLSAYGANAVLESARQRALSGSHEKTFSPNSVSQPEDSNQAAGGLGIQFGDIEYTPTSQSLDRGSAQEHNHQTMDTRSGQSPVTPVNGLFEKAAVTMPLLSPVREVRTPSPIGKRMELSRPELPRPLQPLTGKLDLRIPSFAELVRARQGRQDSVAISQSPSGASSSTKHTGSNGVNRTSPHQKSSPTMGAATATARRPSPLLDTHHEPLPSSQLKESSQPSNDDPPNRQSSHPSPPPVMPSRSQVTSENHKAAGTSQPHTNGWQQQSSKKSKRNSRSRPGSGNVPKHALPVSEAERKGG